MTIKYLYCLFTLLGLYLFVVIDNFITPVVLFNMKDLMIIYFNVILQVKVGRFILYVFKRPEHLCFDNESVSEDLGLKTLTG